MAYFIATLHPNLEKHNKPDYQGPWLSEKEQREQIDAFYNEKKYIPLSYEHLNCGSSAYVPREDRIGHVIDLFQGKNGDLMVKCYLSSEHPASFKINRDIIENKIKWGVSVGLIQLPSSESGIDDKIEKKLIHVAFTTDPGFAEQNTFLHYWGLSESNIDYVIGKEYFKEGSGKSYANESLVKKIRGIILLLFRFSEIFCFVF